MTKAELAILFKRDSDEQLILERSYPIIRDLTPEVLIQRGEKLVSQFQNTYPTRDDGSGTTYIAYILIPIQPDLSYAVTFGTQDFQQFCEFIVFITSRI